MFAREVRWLGVLSGSFPIACTCSWGRSVTIDFAFDFELALMRPLGLFDVKTLTPHRWKMPMEIRSIVVRR